MAQDAEWEAAEGQSNGHAAGLVRRDGFASQAIERSAETAGMAVAEQARAAVEARFVMALKRPRDLMMVRERLLADAKRPGFAELAEYSKPTGGQRIVGPSIRFAEAAIRAMGNIAVDSPVHYEDEEKRIIRVTATDLESNVTIATDIVIDKTVERKNPSGRNVISRRENSDRQVTYRVSATDDELANKQAALISKALRNAGLRIVPGDIVEDAIRQCRETRRNADAKDPKAALKKLVDRFGELGVGTKQLADYLGHEIESMTHDEREELIAIGVAIKDGDTTWRAVVEQRTGKQAPGSDPGKAAPSFKDRVKKRAAEAAPEPMREPGEDG